MGEMIGLRVAGVALAVLAAEAGCWMSMPALESGVGGGALPAVIAPESEPALAESDLVDPSPFGDPIDDDPPIEASSSRLEVEATLVEPRSASHCGRAKWVVVMRYEVRRVIAGTYAATDLYVAHMCPEMGLVRCRGANGAPVRQFRAGDVHRLQLVRGAGDGALVDKFAARELPRYRARCGELVAPGK